MDGLQWKTLIKMDDLGGPPLFLETPNLSKVSPLHCDLIGFFHFHLGWVLRPENPKGDPPSHHVSPGDSKVCMPMQQMQQMQQMPMAMSPEVNGSNDGQAPNFPLKNDDWKKTFRN